MFAGISEYQTMHQVYLRSKATKILETAGEYFICPQNEKKESPSLTIEIVEQVICYAKHKKLKLTKLYVSPNLQLVGESIVDMMNTKTIEEFNGGDDIVVEVILKEDSTNDYYEWKFSAQKNTYAYSTATTTNNILSPAEPKKICYFCNNEAIIGNLCKGCNESIEDK